MIYLIVGRTGAGKDYIAGKLQEKGFKVVKSYTTRPKRHETEDSHIFITKEEADMITDKIATTTINGYEYFATATQVKESDIYIIDPNGIYELTKNMPDEAFHILYITADPMERKMHAIARADDKLKEEKIFDKRNESEDEQFTDFENKLKKIRTTFPFDKNVTWIDSFDNTYEEKSMDRMIEYLINDKKLHDRMTNIVKECADIGIINRETMDGDKIVIVNKDGSTRNATYEQFADIVTSNPHGFKDLMSGYIISSKIFEALDDNIT